MWRCPGKKDHRLGSEAEYLDHIRQCPFVTCVERMFACDFEPLHMFRSLREKRAHENFCSHDGVEVRLPRDEMVPNPFYQPRRKATPEFNPRLASQKNGKPLQGDRSLMVEAAVQKLPVSLRLLIESGGNAAMILFDLAPVERADWPFKPFAHDALFELSPSTDHSALGAPVAVLLLHPNVTLQAQDFFTGFKDREHGHRFTVPALDPSLHLRPATHGFDLCPLAPTLKRTTAIKATLAEREMQLSLLQQSNARLRAQIEAGQAVKAQLAALKRAIEALGEEAAQLEASLQAREVGSPVTQGELDKLIDERKAMHFAEYRARVVPLFDALVLCKNAIKEEAARGKNLHAAAELAEDELRISAAQLVSVAEQQEILAERARDLRATALKAGQRQPPEPSTESRLLHPVYLCVFCGEEPKNVLFSPCLCSVMCARCFKAQRSAGLSTCLICVEPIEDYIYVDYTQPTEVA